VKTARGEKREAPAGMPECQRGRGGGVNMSKLVGGQKKKGGRTMRRREKSICGHERTKRRGRENQETGEGFRVRREKGGERKLIKKKNQQTRREKRSAGEDHSKDTVKKGPDDHTLGGEKKKKTKEKSKHPFKRKRMSEMGGEKQKEKI